MSRRPATATIAAAIEASNQVLWCDVLSPQSTDLGAQSALDAHKRILAALEARDLDRAVSDIRVHLPRIGDILEQIRREKPEFFAEGQP